ncbi:hypothetical protein V2K50_10190 [Pseudomonas alliivorans]|nr:hypothetical protein [Pseudomonas alliivorans]MEE4666895.1 hypothetical protein [Pseudomonas alliivorans]MEE4697840.1 hypothetical protein [Pseudomonas alliivorans]MEE4892550.1 hypothetical protein [Pseudomonas alliivorans]MEE4999308.1 hypothetical protein [Pseudomonas alliivorans]
MHIEQLKDIQAYVQRTADDLERVSSNMSGHLAYLQHNSRANEAQAVSEQIQGLRASVMDLRGVFS